MTSRSRLAHLLLASALLGTACARGAPPSEGPARPSGPDPCDTGFTAPEGFHPTERFTEPYADHLGVRQGYRDDRGRELHVFAGIPGEFGEGLPSAGSANVTDGERATLLGADGTWVLSWDTEGPCAPRAVLGNGFGKRGFLAALRVAGIVEAS